MKFIPNGHSLNMRIGGHCLPKPQPEELLVKKIHSYRTHEQSEPQSVGKFFKITIFNAAAHTAQLHAILSADHYLKCNTSLGKG